MLVHVGLRARLVAVQVSALVLALGAVALHSAGSASADAAVSGPCPTSTANYAGYAITVAPKSNTSPAGTSAVLTATVSYDGAVAGVCVQFSQSSGPSSGWPQHANTDRNGTATVTWSSNSAGTDVITASVLDAKGAGSSDQASQTWTAAPTPSPTSTGRPRPTFTPPPRRTPPPPQPLPPPTDTPTATPAPPSPTAVPTTAPTTAPTTPTVAPSRTPAITPTAVPPPRSLTPTLPPTATPPTATPPTARPTSAPTGATTSSQPLVGTPVPTTSPPAVPAVGGLGSGSVQLGRPSALPGGTAVITGRNCPPGTPVAFSVEGVAAGRATAQPDGSFIGQLQLPGAAIGTHVIDVSCGGRTATVPIDLVVSSSVSNPAAGATAGAVLVFFVLLGSMLLSRTSPAAPAVTVAEPAEDGREA